MKLISDEPLKYTARGNVPLSSLRYEHYWEDGPEMTILREFWYFEDGEVASNNTHAMMKQGLVIGAEQAKI